MPTPLSELIQKARLLAMNEIAAPMESLATAATELALPHAAQEIRNAITELREHRFRVMLVGRWRSGKSTLLNALAVGQTGDTPQPDGSGPMQVDDFAVGTARLTAIQYAELPAVKVHMVPDDGRARVEVLTFDQYRSVVYPDPQDTKDRFRDIMTYDVYYPTELCKQGVTLIESPFTKDHPSLTAFSRTVLEQCDVVIVVYRTDALYGDKESAELSTLVDHSVSQIFTVTNLDRRDNGQHRDLPRIKRFAWSKLVQAADPSKGPYEEGVNMAAYGMYFVDALSAFDGKMKGDPARLRQSGLEEFEEHLGRFLIDERYHAKLMSVVTRVEAQGTSILQAIAQRTSALRQPAELREHAAREIAQQFASVDECIIKLPEIIDECREHWKRVVCESAGDLVVAMMKSIRVYLEAQELHTLDHVGPLVVLTTMVDRSASEECFRQACDFVSEQVETWASHMHATLLDLLMHLDSRLAEEAHKMLSIFCDIHLRLSGPNGTRDDAEQYAGNASAFVAESDATVKQIAYTIVRVMEPCSQHAAGIAAKVTLAKSISVVRPMPLPMLTRIVRDYTADETKACLHRWVTDARPTREAAIGITIDSLFDQIRDSVTTAIRGRVQDLKAGVRVILNSENLSQSEINAVLQSHEAASDAVMAAIASMKAGLVRVASAANT